MALEKVSIVFDAQSLQVTLGALRELPFRIAQPILAGIDAQIAAAVEADKAGSAKSDEPAPTVQ